MEGDLLAVEEPGPWLTIAHDDVPDVVPASTLRFPARSPDVVGGVAAGSRVRFDLVRDGGRLVVTRLERLGPAAGPVKMEVQDQTPHHGGVVAVAGFLHVEAAASRDGLVRLWLTDEERKPVSLARASGEVRVQLADGTRRTLPLAERDGTLVASGPALEGDEVRARVELRRDGSPIDLYFALPLAEGRAGVGGVPAGACAPVTASHGGRAPRCAVVFPHGVLTVATTRDGRLAVVSEAEGAISAWRLPAGEVVLSFTPPPAVEVAVVEGAEPDVGASAIAIRPDGVEAAIAFGARIVRYEVATGRVVRELPVGAHAVRDLVWFDPSRLLASYLGDPEARVLDAETGAVARRIAVPQAAAAVAARSDGRLAAVGSDVGAIVAFDPARDEAPRVVADVTQPVEDLAFAGSRVVWAGADRSLRVWDATSGAALTTVQLPEPAVRVAVAQNDAVVAVALRSGTIELRRVDDGTAVETLRFHSSGVRALAWVGSQLLTGDTDGTLAIWDLAGVPGVP